MISHSQIHSAFSVDQGKGRMLLFFLHFFSISPFNMDIIRSINKGAVKDPPIIKRQSGTVSMKSSGLAVTNRIHLTLIATLTDVTAPPESSLTLSLLSLLTSTALTTPSVFPLTLFLISIYFAAAPPLP